MVWCSSNGLFQNSSGKNNKTNDRPTLMWNKDWNMKEIKKWVSAGMDKSLFRYSCSVTHLSVFPLFTEIYSKSSSMFNQYKQRFIKNDDLLKNRLSDFWPKGEDDSADEAHSTSSNKCVSCLDLNSLYLNSVSKQIHKLPSTLM